VTDLLASVVVAVRDDPRLGRLLDSLAAQTLPAETYEVIVVENGSSNPAAVAGVRELTASGHCLRLHSPDPLGLKADQLNYAVQHSTRLLPPGLPAAGAFLVCYDADSRPPKDSLACFAQAIKDSPGADVFHQSSRFEYRFPAPRPTAGLARLAAAACDAGALRANRFVLGFEIPRLLHPDGHPAYHREPRCPHRRGLLRRYLRRPGRANRGMNRDPSRARYADHAGDAASRHARKQHPSLSASRRCASCSSSRQAD
jgi:hypothetical protein